MTHADSLNTSPAQIQQTDTVLTPLFDIDSIASHLPVADTVTCAAADSVAAVAAVAERDPDAWLDGIEGASRQTGIGRDSGILTILVLLFVFLALNVRNSRHMFSHFFDELGSFKDRNNAFDEHTSNETRLTLLLIGQFIVCAGILLYVTVTVESRPDDIGIFTGVARTSGLMAAYYIFQLAAYNTVGYIFTSTERRSAWIAGFNASQSMLGIALIIPVLLAVFYPAADKAVIVIAASLYFIARLLFIVKGFRIFFINFSSLLYFILYLCTLEIIPALFVYKMALIIV